MTGTDLAGVALMRDFVPSSPFVAHLGITATELSEDWAVLRMAARRELTTMGDTVHGGALATLVDTTAMAAAWCTGTLPDSLRGATVSLSVSYLAPAIGTVEAVGRVARRGRSLVTVDVEASCAREPVARALVTYKIG